MESTNDAVPKLVIVLPIRGGRPCKLVLDSGVLTYQVYPPDPVSTKTKLKALWRWFRFPWELRKSPGKELPVVMMMHKADAFLIWLQLTTVWWLSVLGFEVRIFVPVKTIVERSRRLQAWRDKHPTRVFVGAEALEELTSMNGNNSGEVDAISA